ncbi:Xaa-Pro dipeptidase [Oligoflexus tunisiensis]|uniref:Xaa-Pro dipeptidase n=1 Tax=Oligoflexus tunisiensis TaxID=708132 RepID=UPI00159F0E2B|nr:Xaa-Pro dipeptidase [Oligoflexus tunisiensis]
MGLRELFQDHLQTLQTETAKTLAELKLDGLVLSAGTPAWYFEDDQNPPFRSSHHFRHWCPMEGCQHVLLFIPGQKPELRLYQPADFWHEAKPFEPDFWGDSFQVQIIKEEDKLWEGLAQGRRIAYHGPEVERARKAGLLVAVEGLVPRLNWQRLVKSPYEIQCLVEATRKAAAGHKAAERAFRQGGSELDIHFAYMQAARSQEQDLPYENIIALNEKAAYLHYAAKRDEVHNGKVLLIDAGATSRGYGADITRTYATEDAPEEFQELLTDMTTLQAGLVAAITPNILMGDLHVLAHQRIAELLIRHKIILDCDAQKAIDLGLTMAFFPHGLGHMLGVFVHDVGGKQLDREGAVSAPDPRFPKLRTTRPLQPGTVVTIEPGVYFIKMLLDPIRQGPNSRNLNWALIDRLMPCGGIRIEDNIHIHDQGIRNITREFLP